LSQQLKWVLCDIGLARPLVVAPELPVEILTNGTSSLDLQPKSIGNNEMAQQGILKLSGTPNKFINWQQTIRPSVNEFNILLITSFRVYS
jgi:hypothetical protein